ncbi:HAD family hydrolase [Nitrincola schmidtii]|uniref:HAD family hydrolase n=1 Tax=Nitrincola schmidtii TaxID=1730894 RepID=UPI00124C7941|nr:HAD-IA family hydrolase [Nitrincola schmidtii]
MKHIKGIIFDLDGTLVTSSLDFIAIKQEIGCPDHADVLAFVNSLPMHEQQKAMEVIHHHEMQDAHTSEWIPSAQSFVQKCSEKLIPMAIVTRNSHHPTRVKVARNAIPIQHIVTRETSKPKPDPTALLNLAAQFQLPVASVLMVGDYKYDLQAGRNAKMPTCLVNFDTLPDYAHLADYTFEHFDNLHRAMF